MPRIEANCKNNKLIYPSMAGIQVLEPSLLPPRVDISREKKIRTEAGFESVQTSVEHGHPKQHPNHCTACPSLTCDSCYCLYRLLLLWLLIVIFSPSRWLLLYHYYYWLSEQYFQSLVWLMAHLTIVQLDMSYHSERLGNTGFYTSHARWTRVNTRDWLPSDGINPCSNSAFCKLVRCCTQSHMISFLGL